MNKIQPLIHNESADKAIKELLKSRWTQEAFADWKSKYGNNQCDQITWRFGLITESHFHNNTNGSWL